MNVYVVLYHRRTDEEDTTDVIGVYSDYDKACFEAAKHMAEVKERLNDDYDGRFDDDFSMNCPDHISFGFYGFGFNPDQVWSCTVNCMPLE